VYKPKIRTQKLGEEISAQGLKGTTNPGERVGTTNFEGPKVVLIDVSNQGGEEKVD